MIWLRGEKDGIGCGDSSLHPLAAGTFPEGSGGGKAEGVPLPCFAGGALIFYTVYIPSLDGRFDYLSTTDYPPGQIVVIPFGPEDRETLGIVERAVFYPYDKLPLPLWKMKYILDKAPEPIAAEYRRQQGGH